MRQFFVRGADHISYVDSEVGPNTSNDGMNWITAAYQTNDGASDILLDGVRIHDFKKWNSGAHVDCIGIDDVDGLTIRNSKIWNCEHFSLIFGKDLWSSRAARNVLIENSFLDCCYSGYYSIGLGDIEGPMTIRFNSLTLGIGWLGGSVRQVTLNSNVIANNNQANCSKATWRYNVVSSGSACGGMQARTGFRSPPFDLHLVGGAAAIGVGDPASHPATDIDGDATSARARVPTLVQMRARRRPAPVRPRTPGQRPRVDGHVTNRPIWGCDHRPVQPIEPGAAHNDIASPARRQPVSRARDVC